MVKSTAPKVRAGPVVFEAMEGRRLLSGGGAHVAHVEHVAHVKHVAHVRHASHEVHMEVMKRRAEA